jgi:hypothetical protein
VIAVVIPVLGRPETSPVVLSNIIEVSTCVTRILFVFTPGDSQQAVVEKLWRKGKDERVTCLSVGPLAPGDFARKINAGFNVTSEEYVLLAASDLFFHPDWDVEALRVAEDSGAGVVGTDDMANPMVKAGKHSTHPLVRRSYIREHGGTFDQGPGVVYYEGYDHQAVDNELVWAARARDQWAFARRSRVQHKHPIYDKTVSMDETYKRALAHGREDIGLFRQRMQAFERKELS